MEQAAVPSRGLSLLLLVAIAAVATGATLEKAHGVNDIPEGVVHPQPETAPEPDVAPQSDSDAASSVPSVATRYGFPYYSGYPFLPSGYPYFQRPYPFHFAGHYPGPYPGYFPYYAPVVTAPATSDPYDSKYIYHGPFDGQCVEDGLYYVNSRSFAFCSHGQRTVQSCAEGAANNDKDSYEYGKYYTMNDFCSVNLLARTEAPAEENAVE